MNILALVSALVISVSVDTVDTTIADTCKYIDSAKIDTVKTVHFNIQHTLNFRDPLDDSNKVDWHVAFGTGILFDSLLSLEIKLEGSTERDNGDHYWSHSEKLGFRYGYVQYHRDTEHIIDLLNIAGYYIFLEAIKVGADLHWEHWEPAYGGYVGLKWKFIEFEIVFWDEIQRVRAELTPSIKVGSRKLLELGIKANCTYLEDVLHWNAGYLVKFNLET